MTTYTITATHNGRTYGTTESDAEAVAIYEREHAALQTWRNAPHGGNRNAKVGVQILDDAGQDVTALLID